VAEDVAATGPSLAPLSLTMFAVAILAGHKSGGRRPAKIIRTGFALSTLGAALIIPIVPDADSGWYLRSAAVPGHCVDHAVGRSLRWHRRLVNIVVARVRFTLFG
jgi:hypothetical protein